MLAVGIAGTLAANVLAGTASSPLGSIVAAWPALAFVGAYEPVMLQLIALRVTLAVGNGYSNQLITKFGLTRAQATKVRQQALTEANGHQPDDTAEAPAA